MSKLRTFRIDGYKIDQLETELLAKIEDDDGGLMGTFDMTGEGVFYYRPRSRIMTEKENDNTRDSYDGFISFKILKEIFEVLKSNGWNKDTHIIEVAKENEGITLRAVNEE